MADSSQSRGRLGELSGKVEEIKQKDKTKLRHIQLYGDYQRERVLGAGGRGQAAEGVGVG